MNNSKSIYRFSVLTILSLYLLTACGGGGGDSTDQVDTTAPEITLLGANPQIIEAGGTYSELSATALDNVDGDISAELNIDVNSVDTTTTGSYSVSYNVSDAAGNAATTVSRMVDVVDTTAPTASISFPPMQSLTQGSSVTVHGTASDAGEITVVRVNGVDVDSIDGFSSWQAVVPLTSGDNSLQVETGDSSQNSNNNAADVFIKRADLLANPSSLALDSANDRVLVADTGLNTIFAVGLTTAQLTIFSNDSIPDNVNLPENITDMVLDSSNNRILAVERSSLAVLAVDLTTGARTVISNNSIPDSNNSFSEPHALTLDSANNRVLVLDQGLFAVLTVDLTTGARTILSDNSAPDTNNLFSFPTDLVLDPNVVNNRVVVLNKATGTVLAVDLTTGVRTVISDSSTPNSINALVSPQSFVLDAANDQVVVVDQIGDNSSAIIGVKLSDGSRTLISDNTTPDNVNPINRLTDISLDVSNDGVLVVDANEDSLLTVDLASGVRTVILQSNAIPNGNNTFVRPLSIIMDSVNNRTLVLDEFLKALIAVNLDTGSRSIISDPATPDNDNPFRLPRGLMLDSSNNRVLVVDDADVGGRIIEVNLDTGVRSVFSDISTPDNVNSFALPQDLVLDSANNRALVIDGILDALIAVSLDTGARSIISNSSFPNDLNSFSGPAALALDSVNNRVLVADQGLGRVIAVNLTSGERTVITNATFPNAINVLSFPTDIVLDSANNRVLVTNLFELHGFKPAVIAVDLTTGERTLLSDRTTPDNINVKTPFGLALDSANERALVLDSGLGAVIVMRTDSGERVILSK